MSEEVVEDQPKLIEDIKMWLDSLEVYRKEEKNLCNEIDLRIATLQEELGVLNLERSNRMRDAQPVVDKIHNRLLASMIRYGGSFRTAKANVKLRNPYEKVTFDRKAIDAICEHNDSVRTLVWPHRKVTAVEGSISVVWMD